MTAAADRIGPAPGSAGVRRPDGRTPVPTVEPAAPPPRRRPTAATNPRSLAMRQRSAGNAAVAGLVRPARLCGSIPRPDRAGDRPDSAAGAPGRAPATAEVGKAQAAAKGPPDDKAGQAKAAQAAAPKNLDGADKFAGAMGVRLEAWDLERDARKIFGPGIDPRQLAAVGGRMSAKVTELRSVIASLPLIDIS